jgi:hypothetical protein
MVKGFPQTTVKITLYAFRWILFLILCDVIISIIMLFYIDRYEFLTQIVTMSVGGFFAFFMGYFGWMFTQDIMEWMSRMKRFNSPEFQQLEKFTSRKKDKLK